jgi:hypothetical protein
MLETDFFKIFLYSIYFSPLKPFINFFFLFKFISLISVCITWACHTWMLNFLQFLSLIFAQSFFFAVFLGLTYEICNQESLKLFFRLALFSIWKKMQAFFSHQSNYCLCIFTCFSYWLLAYHSFFLVLPMFSSYITEGCFYQ